MNGRQLDSSELIFEIGLGLLEYGEESLQNQLDSFGKGNKSSGAKQHKTTRSKNGIHKGTSTVSRRHYEGHDTRKNRRNRIDNLSNENQLKGKKDDDSQHKLSVDLKKEINKALKKNEQDSGGLGGGFKAVGGVSIGTSGLAASKLGLKTAKNVVEQVGKYLAPVEEGAVAEEAVVLGDLGLVAAGVELAPIAALAVAGYGLYELGSWIDGK